MTREQPVVRAGTVAWARLAADALTLSRLAGALAIACWPWPAGYSGLPQLLKVNMMVWTTDVLDGPLARYSRTPPSALGRAEQGIDLLVGWGTALALARMGAIPPPVLLGWAALFAAAHVLRPNATTRMAFLLPLVLLPPVVGLLRAPPQGWLYLGWIAVMAVVGWNRLRAVIESFVEGLPSPARVWIRSWLPRWLEGPGTGG